MLQWLHLSKRKKSWVTNGLFKKKKKKQVKHFFVINIKLLSWELGSLE